LHFLQLGSFGLHLGDPALHRGDFFLEHWISVLAGNFIVICFALPCIE
jgi:hypothetical protein